MVPGLFKPYENLPYPCYLLDAQGRLYMNEAARGAAPPLGDEKSIHQLLAAAAQRTRQAEAPSATALPLADEALTQRRLALMPMEGGLLAVAMNERDAPLYLFSAQMREHLTNILYSLPVIGKHIDGRDIEYVEGIQRNCYDLLRLASNLEDAGRAEHRDPGVAADLTALVESLCESAGKLLNERAAPIEWQLPEGPLPVRCDQRLLGEALLNLLRNSMQFTRDGNRITVRLRAAAGKAVLTVEDRGLGIRPENLEHIFEPYFSVDPYGDSADRPGIGLGLTVVRELAAGCGGSVSVESRFGEGTAITLALPLAGGGEAVLGSNSAEYLRNRYSPVYVQLCGFCHLPGL